MNPVFVSYSRDDEAMARQLKHELEDHGFDAWLATDEIHAGEQLVERIQDILGRAVAVVLLIGEEPSSWARYEWSRALQLSWDRESPKPLVAVLLPDAEPPTFLRDQHLFRVDSSGGWGDVVKALKDTPRSDWHISPDEKDRLASRLTEVERAAAAIPDEASDDS